MNSWRRGHSRQQRRKAVVDAVPAEAAEQDVEAEVVAHAVARQPQQPQHLRYRICQSTLTTQTMRLQRADAAVPEVVAEQRHLRCRTCQSILTL